MKLVDMPYSELDLGDNHTLKWISDKEDNIVGATEAHYKPGTEEKCMGAVFFNVPENTDRKVMWEVESWVPLTISPSVLCSCGSHGFIREDKWVPA